MLATVEVRRFEVLDAPRVWALSTIPNVGHTADPAVPLDLPRPDGPPTAFPHLADIDGSFRGAGGDFLVAEHDGRLVGMGGIRPNSAAQVELLHLRVHPATRRRGIGRQIVAALERRGADLGFEELHLDTATNQPEAIAFYEALGFARAGEETRPGWTWTLAYFTKQL
jgi:ribosomal protein S18 acetylase RimI-like enzyme